MFNRWRNNMEQTPIRRAARYIGLNPLTFGCLAVQFVLLLLTMAVYRIQGLSFAFDGFRVVLVTVVFAIWISFLGVPGRRRGWLTAEAACAWLLNFSLVVIVVPGQYAALAIGQPFVDETLAQLDGTLGISVSNLLAWSQQHPRVLALLLWAYGSFQWQLVLAVPTLWLLRDRRGLWEYVFHFHVCLVLTLLTSALWPVAGPYQWFGFTTPVDLSGVVVQVNGFNDGTLTDVRWVETAGLISMPSFHTATALFVTWVLRRHRWIMAAMLPINTLLILATMFTGIHYAADVLAGGFVFIVSMLAYPAVERHLPLDTPEAMTRADAQASVVGSPAVVERDRVC